RSRTDRPRTSVGLPAHTQPASKQGHEPHSCCGATPPRLAMRRGLRGTPDRGRAPYAAVVEFLTDSYVVITTPLPVVAHSVSRKDAGVPSRNIRLPVPSTTGWIISRYSSIRSAA